MNAAMRTAHLEDVATIDRTGVAAADIENGTPYIGLEHIEAGGRILSAAPVENGDLASNKFVFTPQHVLYGKLRPYLAKIATPDFGGICSTDIVPILPGPNLDRSYLTHFLRQPSMVAYATSRSEGINLPRLSPKALAKFEIPLPPLDDQRRIAGILDKADALRQKRKRSIALLDSLTHSNFVNMFGDPLRNPQGLPKASLGDLIKVKSGDGLTAAQMDRSGTHVVYGGNGPNGTHSKYMFEEPKIAIGRVGAYCGAVHVTRPRSWITDNALYVSEIKSNLNLTYLAWALRVADLNQLAGRAAQPLISGGRIYPVEILVPSSSQQAAFERAVVISEEIRVYLDISPIEGLFTSLQHRAFVGEL